MTKLLVPTRFSIATPIHVPAFKEAITAFSPVLYVPLHAVIPESDMTVNSRVVNYPMK
jgi:hypothetical protein